MLLTVVMVQQGTSHSADLAALAGAGQVLFGESSACSQAAEVVNGRGDRLMACTVDGLDVQVVVSDQLPGPLSGWGQVRATARAGPPGD